MSVAIINYGSGNIFSVSNALNKIEINNKIVSNPSDLEGFSTILLPGVGNFRSCIQKFKEKNFLDHTLRHVSKGKKILGICVGMQMLYEYSMEDGKTDGLGLLEGNVSLLKPNQDNSKDKLTLPNMGWSKIKLGKNHIKNCFFQNIDRLDFYFAHSYACRSNSDIYGVASTTYGTDEYLSVVNKKNIIGIQFHPEKSGNSGLKLLKNILSKN